MIYKVSININGVNYVPVFDLIEGWFIDPAVREKFKGEEGIIDISDLIGVVAFIEEVIMPAEYSIEILSYKHPEDV